MLSDLGASAVAAYLYDPERRELRSVVAAVTPLGTGSVERVPVDDLAYASATAFQTGDIITAHSVQELGSHPDLAVFAPFPFTVTSVPLGDGTRRIGVLATYWPQMYRRLPEAERTYLRDIGTATTRELDAFANAGVSLLPPAVPRVITAEADESTAGPAESTADDRGGDRTAHTTPLIYHLHKLANSLISTVRTEEVARQALERVINGFDARAMVITLVEGDRLRVVDARGCSTDFLRGLNGRPLNAASLETDAVNQRRQIVQGPSATAPDERITGPAHDDRAAKSVPSGEELERLDDQFGAPIGAEDDVADEGERDKLVWAVLPLLAGGHAIGSCSIGFPPDRAGVITEHSVLIALATLLGQTFERTRLYDSQHALAQKLQQALLPRLLPQLAGVLTTTRYVPTSGGLELGGDWYDMINLPDGKIAAIIGDVQGHSIAAAVVMGQLRSAVRAYATEGHDPTSVLSRTNRLLVELDTDRFATCCCVWLDPGTGVAEIVSAGHHLPLVRFPDGRYRDRDMEVGIPLGIEPDATYRATRVTLEPGTLIALYTDGLVGLEGPDDEAVRSGLDRALADADGELETVGDLMIGGIADRRARADDAALLIMRYEGASAQARLHVRRLAIHRRDLQGVRRARQFLREWLRSVQLADMSDAAELLASEVITNALVHGDTDVDIHVRRYPERVRVEVRDSDPHLALPTPVALNNDEAEGGRGLLIVSAMASAWGNSPSGRGKTVWFELPTQLAGLGEADLTTVDTDGTT
jgi:anti-sigma regulatory factor (Ser/Thr protein kinase)